MNLRYMKTHFVVVSECAHSHHGGDRVHQGPPPFNVLNFENIDLNMRS